MQKCTMFKVGKSGSMPLWGSKNDHPTVALLADKQSCLPAEGYIFSSGPWLLCRQLAYSHTRYSHKVLTHAWHSRRGRV